MLALPKFDVSIGSKHLFRYVFSEIIFFMACYSLLDSKVIGKRCLKFAFDIRELPYKLTIGKETNRCDDELRLPRFKIPPILIHR